MAVIPTRINSSGTFLVNGDFDEVTFNTVNPVIKNLLVHSNSFSTSPWTKGSSATLTPTASTAPDGTITAWRLQMPATSGTWLDQPFNAVAGVTYIFSIYAKYVAPTNNQFSMFVWTSAAAGGPTSGSGTTNVVTTDNWTRYSVQFTAATTGTFSAAIDNTGNTLSPNVFIWGAQLEVGSIPTIYQGVAAAGTLVTPTFVNKTTTGTYYVTGNFDEVTYNSVTPVIKNLLTYTEEMDQWIKTNVTVNSNVLLAPNNTLTADLIVESTVSSNKELQKIVTVVSGVTYTISVYAKTAGRQRFRFGLNTAFFSGSTNAYFDLVNGATSILQGGFTSSTIQGVGNDWYRCTATFTPLLSGSMNTYITLSNASNLTNYVGDGTSGVYAWGAQVEVGSTDTIYQGIAAANTLVAPGFVKRDASDGLLYVTDKFDEVTGMIVTSGLVAYYDAGKAASQPATGATWYDISDLKINATPSASPPTFNSAGYFTLAAVNAQRYLTTALNPTTWAESWTIEVWMYTPTGAVWGNGVNRSHHIAKGSTAGTWGIIRNPTDNQVTTWIRGAAEQAATPVATLARDRWHQFVGTWDGINTVSSYLNGEFVGSATIALTGAPDTGSLLIGGANNQTISGSAGTYYDGNIAAVMMYNRALSTAEVNNNFEALRDRFGI